MEIGEWIEESGERRVERQCPDKTSNKMPPKNLGILLRNVFIIGYANQFVATTETAASASASASSVCATVPHRKMFDKLQNADHKIGYSILGFYFIGGSF